MFKNISHPLLLEMSSSLKIDVSFTISSKALSVEKSTKLSIITLKYIIIIIIIIIIIVKQLFELFDHKK